MVDLKSYWRLLPGYKKLPVEVEELRKAIEENRRAAHEADDMDDMLTAVLRNTVPRSD